MCNSPEVGIPFCSKSCAYFSDNVVHSSASHILLCSSLTYLYTYIHYIYKYTYISGAYEGVEGLWPQPYCPSGGEEPLRVSQLHDSDMFVDRFV